MEFLFLEGHKMQNQFKKPIYLSIIILLLQSLFSFSVFAQTDTPLIYNITPQFIQQGQVTVVQVIGENLPNIVGVDSDDVYAVILKQYKDKKTLDIQLAVTSDALGPRNLILISKGGTEATFPFQIIPPGAPVVDNIIPDSARAGETILLRLSGKNLTNPFITTLSEQFLVISSRPSSDGSIVDITVALDANIEPGPYPIIISTPYGQTETSFSILASSKIINNIDSFNADPYSPGIHSVEFDSLSRQITLKGSMFDPDPYNNTITLLENADGIVIGRQIEASSATPNEIKIVLPDDISSNFLSFAVSNIEGRSSNIKTIDTNQSSDTINKNDESMNNEVASIDISTITNNNSINHIQETNQLPDQVKITKNTSQDTNTQADITTSSIASSASEDNLNIIQNLQNLSQYILGNSTNEIHKGEVEEPLINEIKDPEKLISDIEENKQIKNQADLIMIALEEAKQDEELSQTIKKAEALKLKVQELEKILTDETSKNKPDQRKLEQYQKLITSASAESKSQTFTLLNKLLKLKPQFKNLLSQKPFDLAAIQPNIPLDAVVLQYVPTDEGIIIFVVDNKNLKTRVNKYISKDILVREIKAYRNLFEQEIEKIKLTGRVTPITSWKANKSKSYKEEILPLKTKTVFLYNALIGPIEKDIANKKVVAIIANGWLRYLPFQSLAKPTKDGDLNFLISDKSIVYLDSVIAVSNDEPKVLSGMSTITVLANPDGTLIGANKEAEVISKLYTKTAMILVQRPFNIPLINQLAKNTDILHLATHGYLDGTSIDASYLVSGNKKEGKKIIKEKLFLKDIYDLNLKDNKLVVLSGCDTGKLGNLSNEPDDIVGSLASAFRVAGANTILASLWKAHDEATKIIMQNFYNNLKLGLNKAEALRQAELKVKENPTYSHPLFWSLFSLIGDWR